MVTEEEKKIRDVVGNKLSNYLLTESQENLINDGHVDTAFLLRSGNVFKEGDFHGVLYDAPYAAPVEFGTDPHKINPKVLEPWVRRKLGIKNPKKARAVAIKIANKIRARGTEPAEYMQKAIEKARTDFKVKT